MTLYNHSKNRFTWCDVECHRFECVFSSPIVFEVKWHSLQSDKWYQSQCHEFESQKCHCKGGIVGGTTIKLPTTTLKIGPHDVMLNAIKDLSVSSHHRLVLRGNGTAHGRTYIYIYIYDLELNLT